MRAVLQQGVLKAMLHSPLFREAELTDKQRSELKELAARSRKELVEVSRRVERSLFAELRRKLSPEKARRLVSVSDLDRSGTVPGAPDIFLAKRQWLVPPGRR